MQHYRFGLSASAIAPIRHTLEVVIAVRYSFESKLTVSALKLIVPPTSTLHEGRQPYAESPVVCGQASQKSADRTAPLTAIANVDVAYFLACSHTDFGCIFTVGRRGIGRQVVSKPIHEHACRGTVFDTAISRYDVSS